MANSGGPSCSWWDTFVVMNHLTLGKTRGRTGTEEYKQVVILDSGLVIRKLEMCNIFTQSTVKSVGLISMLASEGG